MFSLCGVSWVECSGHERYPTTRTNVCIHLESTFIHVKENYKKKKKRIESKNIRKVPKLHTTVTNIQIHAAEQRAAAGF